MTAYHSVAIPYTAENPTHWHPTVPGMTVTRGAFETKAEADAWASKNIPGHEYSIREFSGC